MSSTRFPSRPRSSTTGEYRTVDWSDETLDSPLEFLGCCRCYRDLSSHGTKPSKWKTKPVTFWLLECGHVACAICLGYETGQPNADYEHQCPLPSCQSSRSAIHELNANAPIPSAIASYLLPPRALADQLTSAWGFQFEQMSLRIQNLRMQVESQRKTLDGALPQLQSLRALRGELANLAQVNDQLRLELEHNRKAPLVHRASLNESNSAARDGGYQQPNSRQPQNLHPAKRRKPAYQAPAFNPGSSSSGEGRERARFACSTTQCRAWCSSKRRYAFDPNRPPSRNAEHPTPQKNDHRGAGSGRFKPPYLDVIPEDARVERAGALGKDRRAIPEVRTPLAALQSGAPRRMPNEHYRPTTTQKSLSKGKGIVPLAIPSRSLQSRNVSRQQLPNVSPIHHESPSYNNHYQLPAVPRASNHAGFTYHPDPNEQAWDQEMVQSTSRFLPPPTPSTRGRAESRAGAISVAGLAQNTGALNHQPTMSSAIPNNASRVPRFGPARGGP
ncbi:hypothetical protein DFH28DRAFT_1148656 [Melampsora americana]|nr:hypothetical protein DFH28DRAFT_1148656 [Melampsora americana]